MNQPLLEQTLELLRNRSAQIMLKQIARETKLSYPWICAFHLGKIIDYKHPKVEAKINKLYKYLIEKQKEQPKLPLVS